MKLSDKNKLSTKTSHSSPPSCGWAGEGGTRQRLLPQLYLHEGVGETESGEILLELFLIFFQLLHKHVKSAL